jgi:lactate permease
MMLFLQAAPLVALVLLLASGRAGAALSCLVAIALTLPPLLAQGQARLPDFVLASTAQGLWLAIVPVGIISGGLVFHAAVSGEAKSGAPAITNVPDALFTAAFLLGPFTETVTGFGVGTVFALGTIRAAGVSGVPAALIALVAQALIPWGGLGPGTAIGAALAGIPAQALASRSAWQTAALLLLLLPAFWHWCRLAGHPVPTRQRAAQGGWVLATGALLIAWHHAAPWEVCGLLATGIALAAKKLHANPPRTAAMRRHAATAALPYALLALVLLASRLWRDAPALHPIASLPALPANHAMFALWLVALALLLARHGAASTGLLAAALRRARLPAIALLMFVLLARFLSNAGIPQALALALSGGFGAAAPFAAPLLAGFAGFFAGTNVGANSAMMPLQAALGRLAGLGPTVLPAVQNGTPFLLLSPQLTTIAAALAGGGATPARIWRRAWPIALAALAVGMASVAMG